MGGEAVTIIALLAGGYFLLQYSKKHKATQNAQAAADILANPSATCPACGPDPSSDDCIDCLHSVGARVAYKRAYEANSMYHDFGMNPMYMKYGPYGAYFGAGYDSYLGSPSPK